MYPMLEQLSQQELIKRRADGRYELTEEGKKETPLSPWQRMFQPTSPPQMIQEIKSYVSYFEDIGKEKVKQYEADLKEIRKRLDELLGP
ncbi:MAG: hypothetical protein QXP70_03930, partial [Methanomassiliicoccales archaeon]